MCWWKLDFSAPPRTFSQFLQATEWKGPESAVLWSTGWPLRHRAPSPLRKAKHEAFCDLSPDISQFPCPIFFYLLLKETFLPLPGTNASRPLGVLSLHHSVPFLSFFHLFLFQALDFYKCTQDYGIYSLCCEVAVGFLNLGSTLRNWTNMMY